MGAAGIVDVGGWVAPAMELVYEQGTPELRGQWPAIEPLLELSARRPQQGDWVHPALGLAAAPSRRARRDAWRLDRPRPAGGHEPAVPVGVLHDNAAGRVSELEQAGVALQLISPGPSIDACLRLPSTLAAGVFGAYNRYLLDYCGAHPQRLGAVLQLHGSEPRWSAEEVAELRREPSVRAVSLCIAVRISPEDRRFDPVWEALEQSGLPLLHRPALCARVWSPGRLVAYLRAAGVLARYPGLRVGFVAGDSELSGTELARPIEVVRGQPDALGPRLFAAATAEQLQRGCDDPAATLWASDFPLAGSLRTELESARRILGPRAEDVLVTAPRRFLGC